MTGLHSASLQAAVFEALQADAGVTNLVGEAIHDAPPHGVPPALYLSLGPEAVRDRSHASGALAYHDLTVSVVSDAEGFASAKSLAGAVIAALGQPLPLMQSGRIVAFNFTRARSRRTRAGQTRRIDLTFRAIVEDD